MSNENLDAKLAKGLDQIRRHKSFSRASDNLLSAATSRLKEHAQESRRDHETEGHLGQIRIDLWKNGEFNVIIDRNKTCASSATFETPFRVIQRVVKHLSRLMHETDPNVPFDAPSPQDTAKDPRPTEPPKPDERKDYG